MVATECSEENNGAVGMLFKMYFLLDTGSRFSANCNVT